MAFSASPSGHQAHSEFMLLVFHVVCFVFIDRQMYPTVEQLISEECCRFLLALAIQELRVTNAIEFSHRNNAAVSQSKGPAKPSNFRTMANASVLNGVSVLHSQSMNLKHNLHKTKYRQKRHPDVRKVAGLLNTKLSGKKRKRQEGAAGPNPKLHFLNKNRSQLKELNLGKVEFQSRVNAKAKEYDEHLVVRVRNANQLASADRQTHRQTDRQTTDRQTDRQCRHGSGERPVATRQVRGCAKRPRHGDP